jgi:predicted Zn-ribbon and HTH transcriptional regulator
MEFGRVGICLSGEKTARERQLNLVQKPPKCPVCGKILDVVYENEYWTYTFDEKTGGYKGNLVDIEIRCPYCKASARNEFPEGVCSYSSV